MLMFLLNLLEGFVGLGLVILTFVTFFAVVAKCGIKICNLIFGE